MQSQLKASGEFLALSRSSPNNIVPTMFTLGNGTLVNIQGPGIIRFTPKPLAKAPKYIVISSGIHGNETAPIEMCDAIVRDILTEKCTVAHPVLFIFGNLPAMDLGKRFVEENMNRLFCGAHSKGSGLINKERRRAKFLENAATVFFNDAPPHAERFHYDLHTAIRDSKNEKFAVYPHLHGKKYSLGQLTFLANCGVRTILLSASPTTTFSYYSSRYHKAHAFTVELGKVKAFGENDMSRFDEAKYALETLIYQENAVFKADLAESELYRVNQVINRQKEDFTLHFADDIPNFTEFKEGDLLASESGKSYYATQNGEAIVFPNANVAIGQRALLTVIPASLEQLNVCP